MIIRNERGFSLTELMITMIMFALVIVAASNIFLGVLGQFKQQTKIAETNIEGVVGLQMLKADIEQAGYGLPFDINGAVYAEAANDSATVTFNGALYNDAAANVPRAVLVGGNATMTGTSDVLAVKATNVAMNDTAQKWAYIANTGAASSITTWTDAAGAGVADENLLATDRVTVLQPVVGSGRKILQVQGGNFFVTYGANGATLAASAFAPPTNSYETFLVYGIRGAANPIMPFNRADFYVRTPGTMPVHCATGTGILYKGTIDHTAGGGGHTEYPLLDCVAAMKIVLARDTDANGSTDSFATLGAWPILSGAAATTASEIRSQLKEIRVYILLHEGQRDATYTSPATITITDPNAGNLLVYNVPDRNYRWKIYTMVITPYNLR